MKNKVSDILKGIVYFVKVLFSGQINTNILLLRYDFNPINNRHLYDAYELLGYSILRFVIRKNDCFWEIFLSWEPITIVPSGDGLGCNTIILPKSVVEIGDGIFSMRKVKDTELPGMRSSNGWIYMPSSVERLNLPLGLRKIGNNTFRGLEIQENVKLPDGLEYIGDNAFAQTGLKSVIIPASVIYLGKSVFDPCFLKELVVIHGNRRYDSRNNCNAIIETATNKLIQGSLSTIIPQEVTEIDNNAFSGVRIARIVLPDSIKRISKGAFSDCWTKEIIIPSGVTEIDKDTFNGAHVPRIVLPESITKIMDGAFSNCRTSEIVIPKSVTYIGSNVFDKADMRKLVFTNKEQLSNLILKECVIGELILPENLDEISSNLFSSVSIYSIELPGSIRKIHKGAFQDSHWGIMRIDSRITVIEEDTFSGSTIQQIILPSTLKKICESAFFKCELEQLAIPEGLTDIERSAFYRSSIKKLILPKTLKYVGEYAFSDCYNLQELKVPINAYLVNSIGFTSSSSYGSHGYTSKLIVEGDSKYILYEQYYYAY